MIGKVPLSRSPFAGRIDRGRAENGHFNVEGPFSDLAFTSAGAGADPVIGTLTQNFEKA